jgi:hypothetical protein
MKRIVAAMRTRMDAALSSASLSKTLDSDEMAGEKPQGVDDERFPTGLYIVKRVRIRRPQKTKETRRFAGRLLC